MKCKRLFSGILAVCMLGSLSLGAAAEGTDGVFGKPGDANQTWLVGGATDGNPSQPIDGTDLEMTVEPYKNGFTVEANPAAQGEAWKFVNVTMKVDLDKYPMLVFNVEESTMDHVEIKTTKGDTFGDAASEYPLLSVQGVKREVINLQDFASLQGDTTKTGEGEETVMLFIAFFPKGSKGAWEGSAKISELGFMTEEAATPATTAAPTTEPSTAPTDDDKDSSKDTSKDSSKDANTSGNKSDSSNAGDTAEGLPVGAIVGIVAAVVVVAAVIVVVVVMKKKKGGSPKA